MLKKETLNLLNNNNITFKDIFSICVGKLSIFQDRLIDYIGKYDYWDTNVKEGILKLDNKIFNVEYIGSTSNTDNFWYSAECENVIPDEYVNLMIQIRNNLIALNLNEIAKTKINIENDINGWNLSMIYAAFAPENVTCFCGSGNISLYMFIKNLPDTIFKKVNSIEFSNRIMTIISSFNIKHKLMIEALLIENEIEYSKTNNNIIAKFNADSILTIEFDEENRFSKVSGNLSL